MKSLFTITTLIAAATALTFAADKPKYKDGGCCDKADKKGEKCKHPCCVEAESKNEVCKKCNG